jgi:hypothetical protein
MSPVHLILLNLLTLIIFGEEYKSRSSSISSFLHHPVTSSFSDPNTFLSILFSKIISLCSSLNVGRQASYLNKAGRIIFLHILFMFTLISLTERSL